MNELKTYYADARYFAHIQAWDTFVVAYRADDPAIISALKDSEDLATIKHLVGAHSVDEIKQWKQSHEAMEKAEMLVLTRGFYTHVSSAMLLPGKRVDTIHVRGIGYEATAPTLIEAIEQIPDNLIATVEHYRTEVERLSTANIQLKSDYADLYSRVFDVEMHNKPDIAVSALTAERDRFREQRDNESWMHAACLSIAEGVPGWNEMPPENDSLAMIKVRQLRRDYESLKRENAELKKRVDEESKNYVEQLEITDTKTREIAALTAENERLRKAIWIFKSEWFDRTKKVIGADIFLAFYEMKIPEKEHKWLFDLVVAIANDDSLARQPKEGETK